MINRYGKWNVETLGNPANHVIQWGIPTTLKDNWTQNLISWGLVNGYNGHYFCRRRFKSILSDENCCILIIISLMFVPNGSIDNKSYFSGNILTLNRRHGYSRTSPCQTRRTVVMSVERSETKGQSPRLFPNQLWTGFLIYIWHHWVTLSWYVEEALTQILKPTKTKTVW